MMKIKSTYLDSTGAFRVLKARKTAINNANPASIEPDFITEKARALHQGVVKAKVVGKEFLTPTTARFTLEVTNTPYFSAGQYLALTVKAKGSLLTRPYSISSSPSLAIEKNQVQIIVKRNPDGVMSPYLLDELVLGQEVEAEIGLGEFTLNPLRDKKHIVALAGGVGVAPFLSLAKSLREHNPYGFDLTILFGATKEEEIIAKKELDALVCDFIHVIYVLSDEPSYKGKKGFIDASLIQEYSIADQTSYFFCGPGTMLDFVEGELSKLGYDLRRLRKEGMENPDLSKRQDYPLEQLDKVHQLKVKRGIEETIVPCYAKESVATALERASIRLHTCCKSGFCGACRIELLDGLLYVIKEKDRRRAADKELGFYYACNSYPLSDITIKIPQE